MTWLSYVFLAATVAGFVEYGHTQNTHPVAPWQEIGSSAYVNVVNYTPDSIPVGVIAPKVDRVIRLLGWVPANDSLVFRLPYADTPILLLVNSSWLPMEIDEPSMHRVEVRPVQVPGGKS